MSDHLYDRGRNVPISFVLYSKLTKKISCFVAIISVGGMRCFTYVFPNNVRSALTTTTAIVTTTTTSTRRRRRRTVTPGRSVRGGTVPLQLALPSAWRCLRSSPTASWGRPRRTWSTGRRTCRLTPFSAAVRYVTHSFLSRCSRVEDCRNNEIALLFHLFDRVVLLLCSGNVQTAASNDVRNRRAPAAHDERGCQIESSCGDFSGQEPNGDGTTGAGEEQRDPELSQLQHQHEAQEEGTGLGLGRRLLRR